MRTLVMLAALCVIAVPASAQSGRGTITGVVTDTSAGVLPAATVTVTNVETGVEYTTVSNDRGLHTVPNLPPGNYAVSFTISGMKTVDHSGITVSVNQTVQLDTVMSVGDVQETVTLPLAQTTHQSTSQFSVKVDHNFTDNSRLNGSTIIVSQPRVLVDSGGIWDPSDPSDMGGPLSRGRQQDVTSQQYPREP